MFSEQIKVNVHPIAGGVWCATFVGANGMQCPSTELKIHLLLSKRSG